MSDTKNFRKLTIQEWDNGTTEERNEWLEMGILVDGDAAKELDKRENVVVCVWCNEEILEADISNCPYCSGSKIKENKTHCQEHKCIPAKKPSKTVFLIESDIPEIQRAIACSSMGVAEKYVSDGGFEFKRSFIISETIFVEEEKEYCPLKDVICENFHRNEKGEFCCRVPKCNYKEEN